MKKNLYHLTTICLIVFLFSYPSLSFGSVSQQPGAEEHGEEATSAAPGALDEVLVTLEIPLFSTHFSKTPVALVNDEPITAGELTDAISSLHSGMKDTSEASKQDYVTVLDRLIDTKLVIMEARNIGLDDTDEYKKGLEDFEKSTLQKTLMADQLADLKLDTDRVDKLYKLMSREMKLKTLIFKIKEDANSFLEKVNAGGDYDEVAEEYVKNHKAELEANDEYLKLKDLWKEVRDAAYSMEKGQISKLYQVGKDFIVFKLLDVRFVEDPAAKQQAVEIVSNQMKSEKAREFSDFLKKKWVTIDEELYKNLNFETQETGALWFKKEEPVDFKKFLEDKRPLAVINDDPPVTITVADLAKETESVFFHGLQKSLGKGEVNAKKNIVFENMLYERTSLLEARQRGLDKTEDYENKVKQYERKTLFNSFVNKIIVPDVKLKHEDVKSYYDAHLDEYSTPMMLRMNSLAFSDLADAKDAMQKLQRNADFKWVSANATGLVDRENEDVLDFDKQLLSLSTLPEKLQESLKNARPGERVLYSDPGGFYYLLVVDEIYPPQPKAFDEVKTPIARKLFSEKLNKILDDWTAKLRGAYEVRIFVTRS